MRPLTATVAATGFFVLAAVGLLSGVPVWACSVRSVVGAFVLYVALRLAGWLAVSILASAAVKGVSRVAPTRSQSGDKSR
jgi:hypothetical protein